MSFFREPGLSRRQLTATVTALAWALILLAAGVISVLQAAASFAGNEATEPRGDYLYRFDAGTWGWIHLLAGVGLLACGIGLITGRSWARAAAAGCALVSIVANFAWLPHYPGWATIAIAVDLIALWAVAMWHPDEV